LLVEEPPDEDAAAPAKQLAASETTAVKPQAPSKSQPVKNVPAPAAGKRRRRRK
jgi:hypothetical protein